MWVMSARGSGISSDMLAWKKWPNAESLARRWVLMSYPPSTGVRSYVLLPFELFNLQPAFTSDQKGPHVQWSCYETGMRWKGSTRGRMGTRTTASKVRSPGRNLTMLAS